MRYFRIWLGVGLLLAAVAVSGCKNDPPVDGNNNNTNNNNNNNNTSPCDDDTTGPTLSVTPAAPIQLPAGSTEVQIFLGFEEPVQYLDVSNVSIDAPARVASIDASGLDYVVMVRDLPPGTSTLTVGTGVQDRCGNGLAQAENIAIVVDDDTVAPTVVDTTPADNAPSVSWPSSVRVRFSEPINPSTGVVQVTANGAPVTVTSTWREENTVLQLSPDPPFIHDAVVAVTLSNFEDRFGNALAAPYRFGFTMEPNTCGGVPAVVLVDTTRQVVDEVAGDVTVRLELTADFTLTESDFSVVPVGGASGALVTGSLQGGPRSYSFVVRGVQKGDAYEIVVPTINSGCTALVGVSVPVQVQYDLPTAAGACSTLPTLAQHHTAIDQCNQGTNSTFATSQPTGFTLASLGDAFSIGGVYDFDSIGGGDSDYFNFQVTHDGTHLTEIRVTIAYGCNFQGTGTVPANTPTVYLRSGTNVFIGSFRGQENYSAVNGTGNYGFATQTFQLPEPAGTRTYHLVFDDTTGAGLCMDFMVYVELVDNTRPLVCYGAVPNPALASNLSDGIEAGGIATVSIGFDAPYTFSQSDLSLVQTTGSGSGILSPGSLSGGPTAWSVQLENVVLGDSYDLTVAGGTDLCGSVFAGDTITVNVTDFPGASGACPIPTLPQHFTSPDACNQGTNSTLATASLTGFVLTSVGDRFSVGGIYDSDSIGGSDNDYYRFGLVSNGTSDYELSVRVAYGCNFTDIGTPSSYTPIIQVRNATGGLVGGSINGQNTYSSINGSGTYGYGQGTITIPSVTAPAGTNNFHLYIDDNSGSNWCMDYAIYVELTAIN